jgi:hypothetical protein
MPSSALFKVQTAINNKFQRIVVLLCYYHLMVGDMRHFSTQYSDVEMLFSV